MTLIFSVKDCTSDHPLTGEILVNGKIIRNIEHLKFSDKNQTVIVGIKIPDLSSGKMITKSFILPAELDNLVLISQRLSDLNNALGGSSGDAGTGPKT